MLTDSDICHSLSLIGTNEPNKESSLVEMEIRGFIKPTKKSFPSFVYMAVVRRGTVGVDRRHNWSLLQIAEHRFPNKPTIEGLGPCSTGLLTLVCAAPVSSPWSVQLQSPHLGPCSTGLLT